MSYATCRTDGCGNAGWSIDTTGMDVDAEGNTIDPWSVSCGVCGQVIEDVTEEPYPPPEEPVADPADASELEAESADEATDDG